MMQQMRSRTAIVGALLLLGILSAPLLVGAAPAKSTGPFRYAVWTPYWRKTAGVAETQAHLMQLHEISPFGYTLTADGTIVDSMQLGKAPWPELLARATSSKVTVLPSITSGEGNVLHALLKDRVRRAAHVAAIMKLSETTPLMESISITRPSSPKPAPTFRHLSESLPLHFTQRRNTSRAP